MTLRQPPHLWVRGSEARRKFALTREDLSSLSFFTKESPYEQHMPPFRQYSLREVVELALRKHGEEALLQHFWSRFLPSTRVNSRLEPSVYGSIYKEDEEDDAGVGGKDGYTQKKYWYNAPSTSTVEGRQSVLQGLRTNVAICSVKTGVWIMTGSHVVFADLMHSIADVANYSYRLMELNRSARTRDLSHPYGYAPLRYITADRSFVFLFFVGGVCPVVTGLRELMEFQAPVCDVFAAPALVFAVSAVLEGAAVKAAYREILSQATKEQIVPSRRLPTDLGKVFGYLRHGRDVMSTATFTEASSGVLGAAVGLGGLWASWYLQTGVPDVLCSIVMGSLVCGVSTFLMRKSGNALLGQTLPPWRVQALVSRLEAHSSVSGVFDVKTELVGTDTVRFKAEVQFHPQAVTERILQAGLDNGNSGIGSTAAADGRADPDPQQEAHARAYGILSARLQATLPELSAVATLAATRVEAPDRVAVVAPWLCRNNDLFYESLVWELKDVERVLRAELRDFKNVHIDLEPW